MDRPKFVKILSSVGKADATQNFDLNTTTVL